MAQISSTTFKSNTTTLYADNTTGNIGADDLRTQMDNTADSVVFKATGFTAPPIASDDDAGTAGNGVFLVGDIWIDETNNKTYISVDSTTGVAVWIELTDVATVTKNSTVANTELAYWTADGIIDGASSVTWNNVDSVLTVIGTIASNVSTTGDLNFSATSTGGGAYRIYPDSATTGNPTWLHQSNSSENQAWVIGGVERMRLDGNELSVVGTIAIGTDVTNGAKLTMESGEDNPTLTGTMATGHFVAQTSNGGPALNVGSDSSGTWYNSAYSNNAEIARIHRWLVGGEEAMRINIAGDVGIGTSSALAKFHVNSGASNLAGLFESDDAGATITLIDDSTTGGSAADHGLNAVGDQLELRAVDNLSFETAGSEAMRIDSSGNFLVGKTSEDQDIEGGQIKKNGIAAFTSSGTSPLRVNRTVSEGNIFILQSDGSTIGSIGVNGGIAYVSNALGGGLRFHQHGVQPCDTSGSGDDNSKNLGSTSFRFDNIYATNSTIQTSDRNEKQDIASLTPTEMLVAARLSTGFINFKWKDRVASKGDDARLHSGAIAQDVQDAFTEEGLDAGDYAMFISGTWWEHDVDVPAVEAVEGVDTVQAVEPVDHAEAVEATYDEDGIEITAYVPEVQAVEAVVGVEYVEAVEAKDAHTRTDTYDTLEEAPEGSTERTRLGIRYPELLSFVAAYNEQRFASIEERLATLEAV
jgi:hypothetical protein